MNGYESEQDFDSYPEVRELTKPQRRVLGVLVEKAFTVPESYPLTIKSVVTGANQKSNRSPITNYTEDALVQTLEDLQEMGLIAMVHTESGRTERYRHYLRKRFPFSEPQMAILGELWLRGRQQMGELRARASRMVPVESLQDLKSEIEGLLEKGYVQANGSLDRRGVEIDHNFYPATESMKMEFDAGGAAEDHATAQDSKSEVSRSTSVGSQAAHSGRAASDSLDVQKMQLLKDENQQLKADVENLRLRVEEIADDLRQLRESLGA